MQPLAKRDRQPEVMDSPTLDEEAHHHALRSLARINSLSRSSGIVWPEIRKLARELGRSDLTVLDIATGAGDVPIQLWRRAHRAGIDLHITGCDVSPKAVSHAQSNADRMEVPVQFTCADALSMPAAQTYDVVTCSLFMHHLSEDDTVQLMRRMSELARHLVLINDLVRSRVGYAMAQVVPRLLTRSWVVHIDGPLSVRAAYTIPEFRTLAERAGLTGGVIRKKWPFRFLLAWRKAIQA